MILRECRYLADENIHREVVEFLRSLGCDVLDVREAGLAGARDREVLALAFEGDRVILTHDSDFGTLTIAGGQSSKGIVYLRPGHIEPSFTIETLKALFGQALELRSPFVLVAQRSGGKVRVRVRHDPGG